jgi:hypothetical protein
MTEMDGTSVDLWKGSVVTKMKTNSTNTMMDGKVILSQVSLMSMAMIQSVHARATAARTVKPAANAPFEISSSGILTSTAKTVTSTLTN